MVLLDGLQSVHREERPIMTGIYIIFGGIALFAFTVTAYDYVSQRVNRKAHKH